MGLLDIIHLESNVIRWRAVSEMHAAKLGMSYLGVDTIEELEIALNSNSVRVGILNPVFSGANRGRAELLAEQAIQLVRSRYPSATIFLHTERSRLEPIAVKYGVGFYDKLSHRYNAERIIQEAKSYIDKCPTQVAQPHSLI